MKLHSPKAIGIVLLGTMLTMLIGSCKKTSISVDPREMSREKERIIQAVIDRYGYSSETTIPINLRANSIGYIDRDGRIKNIQRQNRLLAGCGVYDCSNAPTPGDLYVVYSVPYIKWRYKCGQGNDLTAYWSVSAPYGLRLQDPGSGSYSFGNIRIFAPGGSVLATSGNLGNGNLSIKNEGTDPNCSSNTLYTVTYTWANVSDTYFPGNGVECSMTLYNDCAASNYNHVVGYTGAPPAPTSPYDVFTHPCYRVDKAWVNPYTGPGNCATIAGGYVICTPPGSITGTDFHQVEYRAVNHGTSKEWNDQSTAVYNGVIPFVGTPSATMAACCDVLYLSNMISGQWLVRYRNIYSTTCQQISGTNSNWGTMWVTEYWNL